MSEIAVMPTSTSSISKGIAKDGNKTITSFFKAFTIPKERVPSNDDTDDEIIVMPPTPSTRQVYFETPAISSPIRTTPESSATTPERSPNTNTPTLDGVPNRNTSTLRSPMPSVQRSPVASEQIVPLLKPIKFEKTAKRPETLSFSSFSTLSSLPASSQSSRRRTTKDGLQAVINSDSGTEESSEELVDLESFLPRKRQKLTPPATDKDRTIEVPSTVKPAAKYRRQSGRISDQSRRSERSPRLPPSPPRTSRKPGFLMVAKQYEKAMQANARIAEAEATVKEAERRRAERAPCSTMAIDGMAMAAAAADNSDEGERMIQAMERTEALEDEERFYFFPGTIPQVEDSAFPTGSLPKERWARILKNGEARMQACLTGFAAELAAADRLPFDVIDWMAGRLVHEARDELCEAYIETILNSTMHKHTIPARLASLRTFYFSKEQSETGSQELNASSPRASTMNVNRVVRCTCSMSGADGETVACSKCGTSPHISCCQCKHRDENVPVDTGHPCVRSKPRPHDHTPARNHQKARATESVVEGKPVPSPFALAPFPGLRHVIRILQHCAPLFGEDVVSRAVADLALANIDERIRHEHNTLSVIRDGILTLIDAVTASQIGDVYEYLRERLLETPNLSRHIQCRIITTFPATTAASHLLRRRLALFCVTRDRDPNRELSSPNWPKALLNSLRKASEMQISDTTDYALLTSLTQVLDIAIDCGFSANIISISAPVSTTAHLLGQSSSKQSGEEQAFNAQIDALATQLRQTASRIKDAGATHLRRTEAKSAMERLVLRLETSVRTRPREKKGVFGASFGLGRQRLFMDGFAKKVTSGVTEAVVGSPTTDLSDGYVADDVASPVRTKDPGVVGCKGAAQRSVDPT